MAKAPGRLLTLLDYAAVTLSGHSSKIYARHLQPKCDISCSFVAPGVPRPPGASIHSSASVYSRRLPNRRTLPQYGESAGAQAPKKSHVSHVSKAKSQAVSESAQPSPSDTGDGRCSAITRRYRRLNASRNEIKRLLSNLHEYERQDHGAEAQPNPLPTAETQSSAVGSLPPHAHGVPTTPLRASSDATHKHQASKKTSFQQPDSGVVPPQQISSSNNSIFGDLFASSGSKADNVTSARPGRLRRVLHSLGTGDMLEAMVTVSEAMASAMELLPVVWNAFRGSSTPQRPHDDTSQASFKFAKGRPNKPAPAAQSKSAVTAGKAARNVGKQGRADAIRAKRIREISWATKHVEKATGKGRTRLGANQLSVEKPSNQPPAAVYTEETISDVADDASTSLPQDAQWPASSRLDVPGWLSGWPVPGIHGSSMYKPDWADLVPSGSSATSDGRLNIAPGGVPQGDASLLSAEGGAESLSPLSEKHLLPEPPELPRHVASGGHLQEWRQIMAHTMDAKPKSGSWHRLADDLSLSSRQTPSSAAILADRVSVVVAVRPYYIMQSAPLLQTHSALDLEAGRKYRSSRS